MTSGMFAPAGTSPPIGPMPSVNLPFASVVVIATGWPETRAVPVFESHGSQLGPSAIGSSGLFGTNTVMLASGLLPAGSYTVPLTVVRASPAQAGTAHEPILHVDCWHCSPWQAVAGMPASLGPEP